MIKLELTELQAAELMQFCRHSGRAIDNIAKDEFREMTQDEDRITDMLAFVCASLENSISELDLQIIESEYESHKKKHEQEQLLIKMSKDN